MIRHCTKSATVALTVKWLAALPASSDPIGQAAALFGEPVLGAELAEHQFRLAVALDPESATQPRDIEAERAALIGASGPSIIQETANRLLCLVSTDA